MARQEAKRMSEAEEQELSDRLVEAHNSVDATWRQFREKFMSRVMEETEQAALALGSRDELLALAEAGQCGAAAGSAFAGRNDAEHLVFTTADICEERLTQLREKWAAVNVGPRRTASDDATNSDRAVIVGLVAAVIVAVGVFLAMA